MARKIMVVDDEQEIVELTESMLRKYGYEVMTAFNGREALELLRQEVPDLIITDVLMPEMDGYAFYKQLKTSKKTAHIPVVILTARGLMEDSFKAIGVDSFVTKPFSAQELRSEIEYLLKSGKEEKKGPARVLAVGTEKQIIEELLFRVKREGYEVDVALNGAELIVKTVKFEPDLIIMDIQLEDMPGPEVIRVIRRLPQYVKSPILLYSYFDPELLGSISIRQRVLSIDKETDLCLKAGATQYIGRFNDQSAIKAINSFLRK